MGVVARSHRLSHAQEARSTTVRLIAMTIYQLDLQVGQDEGREYSIVVWAPVRFGVRHPQVQCSKPGRPGQRVTVE